MSYRKGLLNRQQLLDLPRRNATPQWRVQPLQQQFTGPGAGQGNDGGGGAGEGGAGGNDGGDGGENPPDGGENPPDGDPKDHARTWEKRAKANKTALDKANADLAALKNASQSQLDAIAKALGLKQEDATPEQLQQALQESQGEAGKAKDRAKRAETRLAVFTAAGKIPNLDPNSLVDSISFMEAAAKLDPDADDFTKKIEALVKERAPKGSDGSSGYSAPVGGGRRTDSNDEQNPRKLAERIGSYRGFQ